ncbi:MAG: hypothetical protein QXM68_03950 [Candidatus Aenigmatarchaeota archaeon]|nr:hypothetical protein [Candidatus Aenigmarchaeota archaeon]
MVSFSSILNYYSRKDVQKAILDFGKDREVVGVYANGSFDKRPNIIAYPDDIVQMVKKGVVSFHCSLEKWSNPMKIETESDISHLRTGWDFIIDPDCPSMDISKIAVTIIEEALQEHGIKHYSIKFTGGKGFHIGLHSDSFPKKINMKPIEMLYPELPRAILEYLKDYIKDILSERLLEFSIQEIADKVGKRVDDILTDRKIDPFKVVAIDTNIISPRHLFRMPYALHEKNHLVSLPIKDVTSFTKEQAELSKFEGVKEVFLQPKKGEAASLVIQSLDFANKNVIEEKPKQVFTKKTGRQIIKQDFPPCMKKLLEGGFSDGRKRGLFILVTFLKKMNWTWEEIEKEVELWNSKNKPPLPARYVKSQLKDFKKKTTDLMPYNCSDDAYKILGIYCGDEMHKEIKNPVSYVYKKKKGVF